MGWEEGIHGEGQRGARSKQHRQGTQDRSKGQGEGGGRLGDSACVCIDQSWGRQKGGGGAVGRRGKMRWEGGGGVCQHGSAGGAGARGRAARRPAGRCGRGANPRSAGRRRPASLGVIGPRGGRQGEGRGGQVAASWVGNAGPAGAEERRERENSRRGFLVILAACGMHAERGETPDWLLLRPIGKRRRPGPLPRATRGGQEDVEEVWWWWGVEEGEAGVWRRWLSTQTRPEGSRREEEGGCRRIG